MREYAAGPGWVLLQGDCLEWLPALAGMGIKAHACVTDPPYATAGGNTNGRSSGADTQYWQFWFSSVWREVAGVLQPEGAGFVFSDWRMIGAAASAIAGGIDRQTSKGWMLSQALAWDRESIGLGSPFRNSFEMIGFIRGPGWKQDVERIPRTIPTVIRHRWPYGAHPHHGAEKPVGLCTKLVGWVAGAGETVLDPFAGSGTTGLAALQSGCRVILIEREDAYCEIAARRLREVAP